MGFLGGITKSIGSIIKPLAQTAIKAIAPQAAGLLKGVVGDLFTAGKGALSSFMQALPLPGPLKSLAQKLLPKGLDLLQNLANGGIDKLLQQITGQATPRTTGDGVTVTPPPLTQPGRTDAIVNNTPAGGTASSSGAATASSSGSGPMSSGALNAAGGSIGKWSPSQGMPKADQFGDLSKPENLEQYKAAQFQYQQMMSNINEFWQLMSNVFKKQSDTSSAIIGNMR